jgi:hypothetical protein
MQRGRGAYLALVRGVLLALLAIWPVAATAHAPTFAIYSKVEATTSGNRIAFVFAFDRMPLRALLERDAAAPANVDPADVGQYRAFLTKYLFDRFSVANAGAPCSHPPELSRLSWDETILHVIAVTTFTCDAPLTKLDIRSLVTHDMPYPHELVSDLKHGEVIVRHFYVGDDTEANIDLASLPASGVVEPWRPRHRGRFTYVPEPGPGRDLNAYTYAELGVDPPPQAPAAPAPEKRSLSFGSFVGQGILHIFTGFDHVLFLVTLLLVVRSWRHLAVVVTSFTAAHSLTLALATLGFVNIPGRIIEPLIERAGGHRVRVRARSRAGAEQRPARSRPRRARPLVRALRLQRGGGDRPAGDRRAAVRLSGVAAIARARLSARAQRGLRARSRRRGLLDRGAREAGLPRLGVRKWESRQAAKTPRGTGDGGVLPRCFLAPWRLGGSPFWLGGLTRGRVPSHPPREPAACSAKSFTQPTPT